MLFERLDALGQDARDLAGVKLCVIGSATAEAVRKRFLRVDLMPEKYVAEDLMAALIEREPELDGKRFLLPRADIARSFRPDLITFTSSSTARNFHEMLGPERIAQLKETAKFGAIGPIAAKTAAVSGMPVAIEPENHDIPSFVHAIVDGLRGPHQADNAPGEGVPR
jgi:uroporphyrinogen III methyltransferase/synthase